MSYFNVSDTSIDGVRIIDTNPRLDHRGAFSRWFCSDELSSVMGGRQVVNINYSKTMLKGSIRGMHFQYPPYAEMKIVRCIRGKIIDTIVDVRKNSPTFLKHISVELSEDNMRMLVVPEGFAHGFQTLVDNCEIMYLVTAHYNHDAEAGLNYLDPTLNINWPLPVADISDRDSKHAYIDEIFEGVEL